MAIEEEYSIFLEIIEQFENQYYPDISEAVVPFSDLGYKDESEYIYHGHERIPFNERHPTYRKIFIREFLTA
ncbi:MAG: hypothetical protein ACW98D_17790 [Promethearchaeota archaeon]|jgi:hypothetical protein